MARDRYALLGLGQARSSWFGNVSLWATSGSVPADFAKCVSVAEVRQRLTALQPFSALLVEVGVAGLDRDLLATARHAGVATIVIDASVHTTDRWIDLGAAAVLDPDFTPAELLYTLATHASVIAAASQVDTAAIVEEITTHTGRLISVCGPGGTGASTTAIALAQAIADDALETGLVALVDMTRNGEQAMLHDAGDVIPGVEELVDAHRGRRATTDEIRSLTFHVERRGYRLLLGTRRPSAWSALQPKAIEASLGGLRRSFRTVVADITADFEGENDGGSLDVEERNALARVAALASDVVVAVGAPGMKGTHSLARTIRNLLDLGVPAERVLPVVTRAPKGAAARAGITRALAALIHRDGVVAPVCGPIFLPDRAVDDALRDGTRLPKQVSEPLAGAVNAVASRIPEAAHASPEPVTPGSLGTFDTAIGD